MKAKTSMKGQFALLREGAIAIGVIAITLGIVATILSTIQSNQTTNTAAYNASANGLSAVTTFSGFQVTIATVLVGVAVLGLLIGGFAVLGGRRGGASGGL